MTDTSSLDLDLALTAASEAPAPDWRTILLATDGSPACDDAVSFAREVALRSGAAVRVVTVCEPAKLAHDHSAPIFDALAESPAAGACVGLARQQVERLLGGVEHRMTVLRGAASEEILRHARATGADLLIVARRPRDFTAHLLRRDHLHRLMRASCCPVVAVGAGHGLLPRRIVAGVDFSPRSLDLVRSAARLADEGGALYLVHVKPDPPFGIPHPGRWLESYETGVRAGLEKLVRESAIPRSCVVETVVVHGHPGDALIDFARLAQADLIAVGRRNARFLDRFLVGNVGSRLARSAPCSLLVVPGNDGSAHGPDRRSRG